jgi:hypothetical protein
MSQRVSLHPVGPLRYDVRDSDGAYVGRNQDGTVKPGGEAVYRWWYADTPGVVVLEDRANLRTHRHHGQVGAPVMEPARRTSTNSSSCSRTE